MMLSHLGVLGLRGERGLLDFDDFTERTSSSNVVLLLDDLLGFSKSKAFPPSVDFGVVVPPLFGVAGTGDAKIGGSQMDEHQGKWGCVNSFSPPFPCPSILPNSSPTNTRRIRRNL
jgi:hypothetical protein